MSGYIYCFSNESMENIYKIGFTTRTPLIRLKEANRGNTWSLSNKFNIEFAKEVGDCHEKERKIHKLLSLVGERVRDNREFFKISLEVVRSVFELIDGKWYNIEGDEKGPEIVQENIKKENVIIDRETLNNNPEIVIDCDKAITCDVCSKIYKNLATYKQHLSYNRCNKVLTPRKIDSNCQYCNKDFATKQSKLRHEEKCSEKVIVNNNITIEQLKNIINNEMKLRER
jgi:hypothetical protein